MHELSPLLLVWAHPDDEAFVSTGLMMSVLRAGGRVVVLHATRGEAGSQDHERWPPEHMGQVRERELEDALDVVGVTEHRWLDYIDGTCADVDPEEAITKVASILKAVEPRAVVTFDPTGGTGHPDHIAVSRWTSAAFDEAAPAGAALYHYTVTPDWVERWYDEFQRYNVFAPGTPNPTPREELALSLTLDEEMVDTKIRALRKHASQTTALFDMFGEDKIRASHTEEHFVLAARKL